MALSLLLLVARFFPQGTALSLIRVHMLVKRLESHWQTVRVPLRAPQQSQVGMAFSFYPRYYSARIVTLQRTLNGLLWAIAGRAFIAAQFAADRGPVACHQSGDLRDAVPGFHVAGIRYLSISLFVCNSSGNSDLQVRKP